MNTLKELQQKILNECDIKTTLIHYGCKNNGDRVNMECSRHKSEGKHSISITDGKVCSCVSPGCDLMGNIYSIIILYEGWSKSEFYSHTLPKACEIYGYDMPKLSEEEIKIATEKKTQRDIILKSHKVFFEFAKKEKEQIFPYVKKKRQITKKEFDSLELGFLFEEAYPELRMRLMKEVPDIDSVFCVGKDNAKKYLKDTYFALINRIIHPHYFNGDISYFTGEVHKRTESDIKYVKLNAHFSVNGHAEGYLLDSLNNDDKEHIIISEGYWDALKLKLCDVPNVAFGTCAISQYFIDTYYIQLKKFKKIVISFDVEENQSGISGAISLAKRLAAKGVENIFISKLTTTKDGKLDIDEWLNHIEKNTRKDVIISELIEPSKPFVDFMFKSINDKNKEEILKEIISYTETLSQISKNQIKERLKKDFKITKTLYNDILKEIKNAETKNTYVGFTEEEQLSIKVENYIGEHEYTEAVSVVVDYLTTNNSFKTFEDLKEIYLYEEGVYYKTGEIFIEKFVEKIYGEKIRNLSVSEAIGSIKRRTYVPRKMADKEIEEICVGNGILNIFTGELTSHTPDKIFLNKFNIDYIEGAKTIKIIKFLKEVLEEDRIITFQKWLGYCLWKTNKYKKAVIFDGGGDTGKTTLIELMRHFLGGDDPEKNISVASLQKICNDKFSCANLYGKILNVDDDMKKIPIQDTGQFKKLTGGGTSSGEFKFGQEFSFKNNAKLMFACNRIPQSDDPYDDAYFNRWIIFSFLNTFVSGENMNENLIDELNTKEEMEGLLVWAIEGLMELKRARNFSYNVSIEQTKRYFDQSSSNIYEFSMFLLEKSEKKGENWVKKDEMYTKYVNFCKKRAENTGNEEKYTIESKKILGKMLKRCAPYIKNSKTTINGKTERIWRNVKVLDEEKEFFETSFEQIE